MGEGATRFAEDQHTAGHGVELINPSEWFFKMRPIQPVSSGAGLWELNYRVEDDKKFGTVGAVALDSSGRLAAATSTGGTNQKLPGRVGDSPLIGSGTWADSNVAVSCTGKGEIFIRQAVAHDLAARIKYANQTLADASREIIQVELPKMAGGDGGLIAVDKTGQVCLEFNTSAMFRGSINAQGQKTVCIEK
jgi:L-asparaginase / beta-aspartyl-peptidase